MMGKRPFKIDCIYLDKGQVRLTTGEHVPIKTMFDGDSVITQDPALARTVVAGPTKAKLWIAAVVQEDERVQPTPLN